MWYRKQFAMISLVDVVHEAAFIMLCHSALVIGSDMKQSMIIRIITNYFVFCIRALSYFKDSFTFITSCRKKFTTFIGIIKKQAVCVEVYARIHTWIPYLVDILNLFISSIPK